MKAEIGLSPTPAVYYKLGTLDGDLSKGPISADFDNLFYKGKFSVYRGNALHDSGIFDIFSEIDWVGLGLSIAKTVIPLVGV